MTVTEQSSRKVILGAGWVNPLTHPYVIESAAHVHVFADGVELVQGVDYTVTNVLNPAGYAVTITNPGSWAPTNWVLDARPPIDQAKDLTVGGTFGAKYEDGLDKLARRVERVWDLARRGLKTGMSVAVGDNPYTLPAPAADNFVGWNAAGTDLENKSPTALGVALVDDDPTLAANSSTRVASQRAVKTYIDTFKALFSSFWLTVVASSTQVAAWTALQVMGTVPTRTLLKGLAPSAGMVAYLGEGARAGYFWAVNGAIPYADPSEGVFVASNTVGWYWERKVTQINPAMFGASLDPTVDSATAIQAMFDFVRLTYSFAAGRFLYSIHDDRAYMTTVSINATTIQQPNLQIGTLSLIGKCTGKIVLDLSGWNTGTIEDLRLYGDKTSQPAVGLLLSRTKPGGVINGAVNATINGGHISGYFSKAAMVQFACEVSKIGLQISNQSRNINAIGYINCGHAGTLDDYIGGLTSDYATLPVAADNSQSNILHDIQIPAVMMGQDVYLNVLGITKANPAVVSVDPTALAASGLANGDKLFGGEILGMVELQPGTTNPTGVYTVAGINVGAGTFQLSGINSTGYSTFTSGHFRNQTGVAVVLNGAACVTWDNFYTLSYGNPGLVLDVKNGISMRDVFLGFQDEPAGAYPVRIDMPTAGQIELPGLQLDFLNQFQTYSDCLIQVNGAAGNVKLTDFRLVVRMLSNTPPNKIFGTPAKITLNNFDIRVPGAAVLNDFSAAGGWNGGTTPTGVCKASDVGTLQYYGTIHEFRVNGSGTSSARAYSTLAGANEGPTFTTLRTGGAGAANDAIGVYDFRGQDTTNAEVRYCYVRGRILVATAGATTGRGEFVAIGGGADAIAGYWQQDLINATGKFTVAGTQVVGPRATGWTAGTGTALKAAWAAYAGQTHTASYVQATIQTLDDNCRNTSQRVKAIEDALRTHGLIN